MSNTNIYDRLLQLVIYHSQEVLGCLVNENALILKTDANKQVQIQRNPENYVISWDEHQVEVVSKYKLAVLFGIFIDNKELLKERDAHYHFDDEYRLPFGWQHGDETVIFAKSENETQHAYLYVNKEIREQIGHFLLS